MKKKLTNKKINHLLDTVVSKIVKKRDRYTCVKCLKVYPKGSRGLTTSHYWSRTWHATRWDFDNLDTLCFGCHTREEHDKQGWYQSFKKNQLGKDRYDKLEERHKRIKDHAFNDKIDLLEKYEAIVLQ